MALARRAPCLAHNEKRQTPSAAISTLVDFPDIEEKFKSFAKFFRI